MWCAGGVRDDGSEKAYLRGLWTLGRAISDRMLVGLAMRTGDEAVVREFRDRVWSYDGDDWPTLALCQRVALGSAQGSEGDLAGVVAGGCADLRERGCR